MQMFDGNTSKQGNQMTELSVMIGRCSSYDRHGGGVGGTDRHPVNIRFSNFLYTEKEHSYNTSQKKK